MENGDVVVRIPPVKNRGGVWVTLGMEEYRIPPLGFANIKELPDKVAVLTGSNGAPNQQQFNAVCEVVHMALARNYPDITADQVREMLDLGNIKNALEAVMQQSGYRSATPGEAPTTSP